MTKVINNRIISAFKAEIHPTSEYDTFEDSNLGNIVTEVTVCFGKSF